MKKLSFLSLLALLAACDPTTPAAKHDCDRLGYAKNSADYQHCVVDMKEAEKAAH